MTIHKNVGPLIAAQARLRERFPGLRLVLTGVGTEAATGRSTSIGSIRGASEPDVIGLGYVSNHEMDDLIGRAAVVVNPSLYEAGNGPGLDAWSRGTPVAMSDIPSFTEHLDVLGVEAAVFDPRDPEDIAAKLADVLDHPDAWAAVAARSKSAISGRTWDQVASEYLSVFDAAYWTLSGG
jgi:glycosyltransferase involved in cell wall biosynthesis